MLYKILNINQLRIFCFPAHTHQTISINVSVVLLVATIIFAPFAIFNVSGMMRNHKLARSIQEVSWSEIVRQLEYKSKWNDRQFIQIDRFFPSSKTCSNDGFIVDKLPLDIREWTCPKCGTVHDRDINAAKNIIKQGLNVLSGVGIISDVKQKSGEAFKRVSKKLERDMESTNHESTRSLA